MDCGLGLKNLIIMGDKFKVGIYIVLGLVVAARVGANNFQVEKGSIVEKIGEISMIRGILVIHYTVDIKEIQALVEAWQGEDSSYWKKYINHDEKGVCKRYLGKDRVKRGLLNVGGEVLHVLFGTATDNQVGKIKESIRIQSVEMKKLHHETSNLEKDLEGFRKAFRKQNRAVEEYQLAQRVISLCHSYDRLLDEARTNQLDLQIFNKTQIAAEMLKFGHEIGASPAVKIDDPRFRQAIQTSVARGKHILISIFFTDAKTFTHFRIRPLPMFGTISTEYKFEVKVERSDVFINVLRSEVGFPSQKQLDHCIKIIGFSLCPPMLIQKMGHIQGCELELIIKNSSNLCEFTKIKREEVRVVKTGSTLVVSGEPGLVVHAFCKGKGSFVTLPGSGVAMFGGQCSIQSNKFRFPNLERRDVTLTLEQPQGLHGLIIHHKEINQRLEKLITPHHDNTWVTGTPQEKFSFWGSLSAVSIGAILGGVFVGQRVWSYLKKKRSQAVPSRSPQLALEETEMNSRSIRSQGNGSDPSEGTSSSGGSAQVPPTNTEGDGLQHGVQDPVRETGGNFSLQLQP